jgi:hypothetical protein
VFHPAKFAHPPHDRVHLDPATTTANNSDSARFRDGQIAALAR